MKFFVWYGETIFGMYYRESSRTVNVGGYKKNTSEMTSFIYEFFEDVDFSYSKAARNKIRFYFKMKKSSYAKICKKINLSVEYTLSPTKSLYRLMR